MHDAPYIPLPHLLQAGRYGEHVRITCAVCIGNRDMASIYRYDPTVGNTGNTSGCNVSRKCRGFEETAKEQRSCLPNLVINYPIPSMYGICTYIWLIFMVVNIPCMDCLGIVPNPLCCHKQLRCPPLICNEASHGQV